ncbi:MAG TPA: FAD-dependent oxidoreductase [Blastococcus sp.]|nr:FAD-dependent oxidoreductase [Blastococcus sp.]
MAAEDTFVIVGAGLAGAKAVETLRAEGFGGAVVLVGDDPELPYERPPLSKGYLQGKAERASAYVHEAGWYRDHDVTLRTGVRATKLDVGGHLLHLDTGEQLPWSKLLLATGSSARRLPIPGGDLVGVRYLRTFADSDALHEALVRGEQWVVVVGGGWIGLEVTAAARGFGNEVTVVEPQPTPLHAVLGPEMGEVFARLHREHGVDVRTGIGVQSFRGSGGSVDAVVLSDGTEVPADLVVVGVGAAPNVALAEEAGLGVDNGVLVDAALRSSHPDVFAAGDVANAFHPLYSRNVRVEHWANALNQGPAAARSMLGQDVSYDRVPYFYTDQYDLGMEYSGLGAAESRVVTRGKPESGEFIAFWLDAAGRVEAAMNVNVWDVTGPLQDLIRSGQVVPEERLADPDVPLEELAG